MVMVTIAQVYREVRAAVLDLVDGLDDLAAARPVPACPEWTVKDVVAHLVGVQADILEGRLDGVATDPWTARQVAERADRSLAEVVEEWRARAPDLDILLDALGEAIDPRLALDAWTHEQDLRHALDRPGGREGPSVEMLAGVLVDALGATLDGAGLPAIRWVDEHGVAHVAGSAPVGATLTNSAFELCRARIGRRSRAQLERLGWDTDPSPWLDAFVVFAPAANDVVEPWPAQPA
jgi:uncharacterized protein (TIGR03083 family)